MDEYPSGANFAHPQSNHPRRCYIKFRKLECALCDALPHGTAGVGYDPYRLLFRRVEAVTRRERHGRCRRNRGANARARRSASSGRPGCIRKCGNATTSGFQLAVRMRKTDVRRRSTRTVGQGWPASARRVRAFAPGFPAPRLRPGDCRATGLRARTRRASGAQP
jgi:hypothetical protein